MLVRGRPARINKTILTDCLLKYKEKLVFDDGRIISKSNAIWTIISEELANQITPYSLYTVVACNRYGIRDVLSSFQTINATDDTSTNQDITDASSAESTSLSEPSLNDSNSKDNILLFTITLPKEEFNSMIIYKKYRRNQKDRPSSLREYTILQPGKWQHMLSEKIWESTKIACGFTFKRHKLLDNGETGYACGTCKCNSTLKCVFDNTGSMVTKIECKFVKGEGSCGKRYLRNPLRHAVAEKLQGISTMKYRIQLAENLMEHGDNVEPPYLFSSNVLRVAKYETMQKSYLDKDPIKALGIMQLGSLKNVIHNIGLNPFFVHYWPNYQLNVYRTYTLDETACVYIDATGSIIKKIKRSDKTKTGPIFLYTCVVNSKKSGLFPVSQMLSESHNTNSIYYWLMEWMRSGAPRPREVVCDFSRALLTAAVRSFTGHLTITDYVEACKKNELPPCYIRVDVAHFIKKYANFLKEVRPRIKQFYLSIIGQLVLCQNIQTAEEILKGILSIARSETEGETCENKKTACEEYKTRFKDFLTYESDEMIIEDDCTQTDSDEDDPSGEWSEWAKNVDHEVQIMVAEKGNRDNAHYMPRLANYLMKDMQLLPLWSCVCRNEFGYGRIPASSASVEGEFNIIKGIMLKTEKTPMRADEFVTKHLDFISGRAKIAHSKTITQPIEDIPDRHDAVKGNNHHEMLTQSNAKTDRICSACANGLKPTGAHMCYVCKMHVHALDECSLPLGEEGYGQLRICIACCGIDTVEQIVASNAVEDWRGLETADTASKGRYLQRNVRNEFLLEDSLQKVPLIRNGSNTSLKAVSIGKHRYTLTNTCAFDSIFQLFVAAYFDRTSMKDLVCTEQDFKFFNLVNDAVSHGIRQTSYRLRTLILKEIYPNRILPNNSVLINCEVAIAFLCRKLFQNFPFFKEVSTCNMGCPKRQKALSVIPIKLSLLLGSNFIEIERDITIQGLRSCCQLNCEGLEKTTIFEIGQFIIIEVYSDLDTNVKLKDIPKQIKFSFMRDNYMLAGMVNFKSSQSQTQSRNGGIGHYTAISHRQGIWMEYDDCKESATLLSENWISCPHIIFYVQ